MTTEQKHVFHTVRDVQKICLFKMFCLILYGISKDSRNWDLEEIVSLLKVFFFFNILLLFFLHSLSTQWEILLLGKWYVVLLMVQWYYLLKKWYIRYSECKICTFWRMQSLHILLDRMYRSRNILMKEMFCFFLLF